MLNRYRWALEALLDRLVGANIPLDPNSLTMIALLTSLLAPLAAWLGANPLLVALVMLSSATLDVLDGYVARKRRCATSFGAFLDSTSDRVADAAYTAAMMLCGVLKPAAALLLLTAEYLVSYA
ncbi:MAG: CDP-alcohol phosphatidyltransferase family protein, partial [Thermoprotei archaeon]